MRGIVDLADVPAAPSVLNGIYDKFMTAKTQKEWDMVLSRLCEIENDAYNAHNTQTLIQIIGMENMLKNKRLEVLST